MTGPDSWNATRRGPRGRVPSSWRTFLAACSMAMGAAVGLSTGVAAQDTGGGGGQEPPGRTLVLVLSDAHTEAAAGAIREILAEHPGVGDRVRVRLFPSAADQVELAALRSAEAMVFNVHQTELIRAFQELLSERAASGAAVYAVGGTQLEDELRRDGLRFDATIQRYYEEGGPENLRNLILHLLRREMGEEVVEGPPRPMPEFGAYDFHRNVVVDDRESYIAGYAGHRAGRPWVGLAMQRSFVVAGQTRHVRAMAEALEARGLNVLPIFGHPEPPNLERFFFDRNGAPAVDAVVAYSLRLGADPAVLNPVLERLGAPVLNAISLSRQSELEWRQDPVGIDIFERTWQVGSAELGGLVAPTVVAAKEPVFDAGLGVEYREYRPIQDGVELLADRAAAMVALRETPNAGKRIALIHYNFPPGRENVGASYLNVLPGSLEVILGTLRQEGYTTGSRSLDPDSIFQRVMAGGRNAGPWSGGELRRMIEEAPDRETAPVLVPVERYREWFARLPEAFRNSVTSHWGDPEDGSIMTWRDASGQVHLVLPAVWWGNVLVTAQPLRAAPHDASHAHTHHDPTHEYHDLALPPHHQYVAFHLWLQKEWKAHAIVHMGTHGTHEWLPGKEVGLDRSDAPEVLLGALPNIYPYIVDDVGEGLQAKRRGMAVVVDHMTPPFDQAELEGGLKELQALVNDWNVASERSLTVADVRLQEINELAAARGILTDLGLDAIRTPDEMQHLEHHLRDIAMATIPFGLHTFGRSPSPERARAMARAMAALDPEASSGIAMAREEEYLRRIEASGPMELEALLGALEGRYVRAGTGNDPLRNPASLPTGKNFYAFNPSRMPTEAIHARGVLLADTLVRDYRERHGRWPTRLTYNLWSTEAIRHEGVVEAQILHLLGVRPTWDPRGTVVGVEPISREELGRPRIDVTVIASGLYRDLFPNLIQLLDGAVTVASIQDEEDNRVRLATLQARQRLLEQGVSDEMAGRLATARIFGVEKGNYGTRLADVIEASDSWESEQEVANVFLGRMSHVYGQGFWGDRPEAVDPSLAGQEGLSVELLKGALSGTDIAVHSRSSNLYGTLDNDDFYQYLGGTALAIRSVDGGASPEVYVSNLTDPSGGRQETLASFMGRELRARYLNPEWIGAMMEEGYSGARFMSRVVNHLWGWQVTVPDVVDDAKWNEFYETYVEDRNELGLEEWFREESRAWAYQTMVARMLEAARTGYWEATDEVVAHLAAELSTSVLSAGAACNALVCNNAELLRYAAAALDAAPEGPGSTALVDAIALARGEAPPPLTAALPPAPDTDVSPAEAEAAGVEPESPAPPLEADEAAVADPTAVRGRELVRRGAEPVAPAPERALFLLRITFLFLMGTVVLGWLPRVGATLPRVAPRRPR